MNFPYRAELSRNRAGQNEEGEEEEEGGGARYLFVAKLVEKKFR